MENSIVIREEENLELLLEYAAKSGFKEVLIGFGSSDIFLKENYHFFLILENTHLHNNLIFHNLLFS